MTPARPLHLCFLLHMHQPFYIDPDGLPDPAADSGAIPDLPVALLPWVRLHGASGYLDLATALSRFPQVHHLALARHPAVYEQIKLWCAQEEG